MEFPEDAEFNIQMVLQFATNPLADEMKELGEEPSEDQKRLEPGDLVVLVNGPAPMEEDLTAGIMADPAEYESIFPDWEERVSKNYRLFRWSSKTDPDGDIGWFELARAIKVNQEQYDEFVGWFRGPLPTNAPEWLRDAYDRHNGVDRQKQSEADDPICGNCGSDDIELHAANLIQLKAPVGIKEKEDGKKVYVPVRHPGDNQPTVEVRAVLHCLACDHALELNDDAYDVNG